MSTEISRKVIGEGQRGEIVVIEFQDNVVDGGSVTHKSRYQIRMGAFTMHETEKKSEAETMAKALAH